jgi:hypothetical protein
MSNWTLHWSWWHWRMRDYDLTFLYGDGYRYGKHFRWWGWGPVALRYYDA